MSVCKCISARTDLKKKRLVILILFNIRWHFYLRLESFDLSIDGFEQMTGALRTGTLFTFLTVVL